MIDPSKLIGKVFGRLTIVSRAHKNKQGNYLWRCKCVCGNELITAYSHLIHGRTQSCGCLNSELASNRRAANLIDKKFGELLVIGWSHKDQRGRYWWTCRCSCGNTVVVLGTRLVSRHTKSCGCLKFMNYNNLLGKRFGNLTVIERCINSGKRQTVWKCKCDCGNYTVVRSSSLTRGDTKSCGCLIRGVNSNLWKGGVSHEPYCEIWLDKNYKEKIKERDNYICQNYLTCTQKHSRIVLHHIDYNKKNCGPANLVTLCNSCNSKANFNRDYWQNFYENIMKDRGLL